MHIVPIYDAHGEVVSQLEIDDEIGFLGGRISKGTKGYYKGIGIPYQHHYLARQEYMDNADEYAFISESDVFYMSDCVAKHAFAGKTGIFRERYQPQFTDFIGTCGVKELSIIEHSEVFKRSSVKVLKANYYDPEHKQYWFLLDYSCGRRKYYDGGDPVALMDLLDYMLREDWNFVWDKNAIGDVSHNGLVSDVADIFHSGELMHKFGTTYAIIYSLFKTAPSLYQQFLTANRLDPHEGQISLILTPLEVMRRVGVNIGEILGDSPQATYNNAIFNFLIVGRNCGHCVHEGMGERIKEEYVERTKRALNIQ